MRAAKFSSPGESITVQEVDRPSIGVNDVLIKVRAASICGSDVHYRSEEVDFVPSTTPITLGHEGAGEVVSVGEKVSSVTPGQHIIVDYVVACGHCEPCLEGNTNRCRNRLSVGHDIDGTFAEYLAIPAQSVIPIDNSIPYAWGSIMGCAGATAFHATKKSELKAGDIVAIFGVGGVGLHAILWCDFLGASEIIAIDIDDAQLTKASEFGADVQVNAISDDVQTVIAERTDNWGVDVALECSGSPEGIKQASAVINGDNQYESGTVVSVGLQEEPIEVDYWKLREGILTVSGDHTQSELNRIAELMEKQKVTLEESTAKTIGLSDIDHGFDLVEGESDVVGKIVVDPDE